MPPELPEVGFGKAVEGAEHDLDPEELELADESDDDEDEPTDPELIEALGFDPDEEPVDDEPPPVKKEEEKDGGSNRLDSTKLNEALNRLKRLCA